MQVITTIGLDIAKSVFQIHGVDAGGQVVMRRQLKRRYVLTFFENRRPRCRRGMVKRRFINPDTLTKSPNYTHVVEVTAELAGYVDDAASLETGYPRIRAGSSVRLIVRFTTTAS